MFGKWMLLLGYFVVGTLQAAGPVSHVYFAEMWLKKAHPSWSVEQKRAFINGTLFPDIRYPAHVQREVTHEHNVTLKQIEATKSHFEGGKKFHAFVDEFRETIVEQSGIYRYVCEYLGCEKPNTIVCSFLKFAEDVLLYEEESWGHIKGYLKHIEPEELGYGIVKKKVHEWHQYLATCFDLGPIKTLKTPHFFEKILPFPPILLEAWGAKISHFCRDKRMKNHIKTLKKQFDLKFKKFFI